MTICTGIRIGQPVDASVEQEKANWHLLFGPDSVEDKTNVFSAVGFGFIVQAFGLDPGHALRVYMVAGDINPEYEEPVRINGQYLDVTAENNVVFLPFPFRYRLLSIGSQPLGTFTVYAVPVPYEFMNAIAASGRFA